MCSSYMRSSFFFNDTATTEIYTYCHTLSLHDALPISSDYFAAARNSRRVVMNSGRRITPAGPPCSAPCTTTVRICGCLWFRSGTPAALRSEEHTSELQSLMRISYAVFCLKKKNNLLHHMYLMQQTVLYSLVRQD